MSDDTKGYQATPAATLEQRIMDPRIAKSEAEWWAAREIDRLRAEINNMSDDVERLSLACAAESDDAERLRALIDAMNKAAGTLAGSCACRFDVGDNPVKECTIHAEMRARVAELEAAQEWRPIESAPKSQWTWVIVFAPGGPHGLPDIVCPCQWHPDAGFCVDELREPTHWMPLSAPPKVTT